MVRIKCQRSTQIHRNVENIDIMYNCAVQSIVLRQLPIDVNWEGSKNQLQPQLHRSPTDTGS